MLLYCAYTVRHSHNSKPIKGRWSSRSSGDDQYIHNAGENKERLSVLNKCFRQSSAEALRFSGITDVASRREYKVLEIGCGAGLTTVDLARQLGNKARITAIDTNADLIANAEDSLKLPENTDVQTRIDFQVHSGEEASHKWEGHFDAVWMRFIVVHVPDPVGLVRVAAACLKPKGIILIEDCNMECFISDPPLYACELLHRAHIEASLRVGGSVLRGPLIGGYMRQSGLENIQCNVFVPVFGKGVTFRPWIGSSSVQMQDDNKSEEHFELGLQLLRMSLESLAPKFMELEVCTNQDLELAMDSLDITETRDYQLFSIPGGQMFQWWATKS